MGFPVIAAVPGWNTYEGELALFANTAASPAYRIYARLASAWVFFAGADSNGPVSGGTAGGPEYSIQSNSSSAFYGDSGLLWMRGTGMWMQHTHRFYLHKTLGNQATYVTYNSAETYVDWYVNDEIRFQY